MSNPRGMTWLIVQGIVLHMNASVSVYSVTVYSRDNFSTSNAHSVYPWVIQNFIIARWECVNNAGKLVEGGSGGDKRWTRMERGRRSLLLAKNKIYSPDFSRVKSTKVDSNA